MGETTGISWCDATFNPWMGCDKVSPGCANCYAETLTSGRMGLDVWGDSPRKRTSESTWKKPLAWNREAEESGRRKRVFCASLADVFEERAELEPWRRELFSLIERTPWLDWLLLTKRPQFARDWLRRFHDDKMLGLWTGQAVTRDGLEWGVLPNVWIGVSIENSRFNYRADVLRQIPAPVRFLSAEPLLGSLLTVAPRREVPAVSKTDAELEESVDDFVIGPRKPLDLDGIDWVIVGGESGSRDARPMHPDWARELRDAVVWGNLVPCGDGCCEPDWPRPAFHFKQWGAWAPAGFVSGLESGSTGKEIVPLDGRPTWKTYFRGSSPKSGGKILDGREWCEIPIGEAVPA